MTPNEKLRELSQKPPHARACDCSSCKQARESEHVARAFGKWALDRAAIIAVSHDACGCPAVAKQIDALAAQIGDDES